MTDPHDKALPQADAGQVCPYMLCPEADAKHWSAILCEDDTCATRGCRLTGLDE